MINSTSCSVLKGNSEEVMKPMPYSFTVGSLIYAQVYNRSDSAYAINFVRMFETNSNKIVENTKKMMRYLRRTKDYMLTF